MGSETDIILLPLLWRREDMYLQPAAHSDCRREVTAVHVPRWKHCNRRSETDSAATETENSLHVIVEFLTDG
jgi:hypothetical protein